jgi:predicted nuclease of predicted toxin-antitoxin system
MRLLTDQDVYELTIRHLRANGHDVVTAHDLGLSRAPDDELLRVARSNCRILVTRDRDYGNLIFQHAHGFGVLYLRMKLPTIVQVHLELERVLGMYSQESLTDSFVVIEPGRHRIRRSTSS